jgi:pimeloyl-ACP methyl ester carboxylesterase
MQGTPGSVQSLDGTRIGYVTGGSGSPLLLVHGGMCSSRRWEPLWRELVGRFEVTAMDRRGRGRSGDADLYAIGVEYDDVRAVAERLAHRHAGPVDVFGHSYGALCALGSAAAGAPVRRLVLFEPPGPGTVTPEWVDRMRGLVARRELGRAMVGFLVEVVGLTHDQVQELRDRPGGEDPMPIVERTLVREAEAILRMDLAGLATLVDPPALLLLGTQSPPWAGSVTRELAAALPAAEVVELPGLSHEAVDTAPDVVAGLLRDFLLPA